MKLPLFAGLPLKRPAAPVDERAQAVAFIVRAGKLRRGETPGADIDPPVSPTDEVSNETVVATAAFIIEAGKRRRGEIV
jgi:hypothetical protein